MYIKLFLGYSTVRVQMNIGNIVYLYWTLSDTGCSGLVLLFERIDPNTHRVSESEREQHTLTTKRLFYRVFIIIKKQ